jgi:amino acid adenylation domain-containing protein
MSLNDSLTNSTNTSMNKALNNIEDAYPLSPMQQGMLFHSLYAPESGMYIEQTRFELNGNLNVPAFIQAWQQLTDRHPVLRTAFVWENLEQPIQIVGRQVNLPWEMQDWRTIPIAHQPTKLENLLEADRRQGFDLAQAPLMRLMLIRLTETTYHFIWSHHHLLLDGWSVQLLYQELVATYKALCQSKSLSLGQPRPYRDYIAWLQQQDTAQAETFWRNLLKGFTSATRLWIDQQPGQSPDAERQVDTQEIRLSIAATTALQKLARQHHLTLSTLLQAAWSLLLSRYSGESDVVFGVTVSGRPPNLTDADAMVGLFINTLPLRVQITPEESLITWLQNLQAQQVEARQYEYSSLIDIHGWSELHRETPLFETILVFENYPVAALSESQTNLAIHKLDVIETTNYPLNLLVGAGSELSFKVLFDRLRFAPEAIARLLPQLQMLLEAIAANPHQRLCELPHLTSAEQQQVAVWNQTHIEYPHQRIHQLFETQVECTPDAIALVFEDQQLSYQELNHRANQLAHYLRSLDVREETLVGLCLERSLDMVIAILAVLKAGAAYVPLDPSYPPERLSFMLQDAQVPVLLTQQQLIPTLPAHSAQLICLDSIWEAIAQQPDTNLSCDGSTSNIAYVIYTSGSTGQPKGAMNTHQGLTNRLYWMQQRYQLTSDDRVLQKTPFSFDVSVWEFLWPIMVGARLVVARPAGHQDSHYLTQLIVEESITTLHFVPSMLQVFLEEPAVKDCRSLTRVICSGEALPLKLQQRYFEQLQAPLYNLYGPTEAAIDVTAWDCFTTWDSQPKDDRPTVPIGYPIANTQIYLLDGIGQPVPVGVPGEVHIGGVQLARGYWQRPDLTAERFIPHPFGQNMGDRLYKTGDLARYLPDGSIEFLGRLDYQVKLRGLRIELGEIEAAFHQHPAIQEVVVTVHQQEEHPSLVAYVVPVRSAEPESYQPQALREFLQTKLPAYMVPSVFIPLDALPLTPNGKVNRQALPQPDTVRSLQEKPFIAPRTPVEIELAQIWSQVLKVESIGIHDHFFDLGGHSLLATQVVSRLREAFQMDIPLRSLFEKPTIAELAQHIETRRMVLQQWQTPTPVATTGRKEIEL